MEDDRGGGSSAFDQVQAKVNQRLQVFLDKATPHSKARWASAAGLLVFYALRIYLISGFYIITYALGIYLLHLFIGFLSPKTDIDRSAL
jgi:hypothetical protein